MEKAFRSNYMKICIYLDFYILNKSYSEHKHENGYFLRLDPKNKYFHGLTKIASIEYVFKRKKKEILKVNA